MQAVRFRRNSNIPGGWDRAAVNLRWQPNAERYGVNGYWYDDMDVKEDIKARLALLISAPPNTHIHGIGFRSDYEGDDRHIEPFFYVII